LRPDSETTPPVSEQPHPGTQRAWLPGIEALRGVAAITVVMHHAWSLSSEPHFTGYWLLEGLATWGVNLFFMLSGYLLADTFWRERSPDMRVYAIRRFFRIAPAYYVNIGILYLFFLAPSVLFTKQWGHQVLASATFTQYLFPGTSSSLNVNGALWTLTIEFMLYAVLPVMALAVRWAPWPAIGAMIAIGVGWRGLVSLHGDGLRAFYFGNAHVDLGVQSLYIARQFLGALPVFALGILARWLVVHGNFRWLYDRIPRMTTLAVLATALPSLLLLRLVERASNYQHHLLFPVYDFIVMVVLFPTLILAAYPGVFAMSMLRRVATWLGVRSYSIYLWHFPIILAFYERGALRRPPAIGGYEWRLPAIAVVTLVFASASYAAVERPGMEFGRKLTERLRRPEQVKEPVPA
jgi:peptidoglycan/LPS O-acetylase OafA/YrhL